MYCFKNEHQLLITYFSIAGSLNGLRQICRMKNMRLQNDSNQLFHSKAKCLNNAHFLELDLYFLSEL